VPSAARSEAVTDSAIPASHIHGGTAAFSRVALAMFAAGFVTFAQLYCVQPLMPVFATEFGVGPARSSLTVSLTTGALSVMIILAGTLSESFGRKRVMGLSLILSSVLTTAAALTTSFDQLLLLRLLIGVALSGVPSVAMAYLGEEIAASSVGLAIGLFIGGSAFGGMAGRLVGAALTDLGGWRLALGAIGAAGMVSAAVFWRALPESRHFAAKPLHLGRQMAALGGNLGDHGLLWLFAMGFLLMGSFITIYNYVGFRLLGPPFELSQTVVGALFTVYLIGIVASTVTGSLADRFGRRRLLWMMVVILLAGVGLTWFDQVAVIVLGVAVVTIGFFGGHAICSSWVAQRAPIGKAQAASLYLFFYYMGSSVVGSLGGVVYGRYGWDGVASLLMIVLLIALAIALRLRGQS
jgi:YNFM family putative membrane transporter